MNKGLAIDFKHEGATLSVKNSVSDFNTIVQNGLVNIATIQGSYTLDAERGTLIFSDAVLGSLITYNSAVHAANFASMDTVLYLRKTDYLQESYERIRAIKLEPLSYYKNKLQLNAVFTGENNTVVGNTIAF